MTSPPSPPLARYRQKRNFALTSEPAGTPDARGAVTEDVRALSFVVQKHWASRLHYDFRLELDGVLLSWAVPKGPSYDPSKMQMAIHVEDHPLDYASFEGTIPPRQYGAGKVIVWDRGTWTPEGDPRDGMAQGKLVFRLHGEKLAGLWELVRIAKPGDKQDAWMLFKKKDAWARPLAEYDVIAALPDSVVARPLGPVEEREPRGAPASALAASAATATDVDLAAAVRAPLPAKLEPQLATLAATAPAGDWIVETKFDGYRLMARVDKGQGEAHHPRRPRLDRQDEAARRRDRVARHRLGVARRRDRGDERRRPARLQRAAERDRQRGERGDRVLRVRPAVP
jgi:bifunctional non-homologous end joining protein LigD